MSQYQTQVHAPQLIAPCGFKLDVPTMMYGSLRAAGAEALIMEACPQCRKHHRIPLPALTEVVIEVTPSSQLDVLHGPLGRNGRN